MPDVSIYAHWHDCEQRWHAFGSMKFIDAPGQEPRTASFHEWGKSDREAADACAELVQMFLDKNGASDVTIRLANGPHA